MKRSGIAVAGTIVCDVIKYIEAFPSKGMLTPISSVSRGAGGIVPNVGIDLKCIDPDSPVYGYGAVADDENGAFLCKVMRDGGLDISGIDIVKGGISGFSDVMTVSGTGERTFFTMNGANDTFDLTDAQLDAFPASVLHIGYILLMNSLDRTDAEYGTYLARILAKARARGIRTSIDVVSRSGAVFREKVLPALHYSDYVIVNELEACAACDLEARDAGGKLIITNIEKAMARMLELGVKDTVIIHAPEGGWILRRSEGRLISLPSLCLPDGWIKGSVGAGDAFCAGCLYALEKGVASEDVLRIASCAAACSLSSADATSGMRPLSEIMELEKRFARRETI